MSFGIPQILPNILDTSADAVHVHAPMKRSDCFIHSLSRIKAVPAKIQQLPLQHVNKGVAFFCSSAKLLPEKNAQDDS
jgi:hypothetical protein